MIVGFPRYVYSIVSDTTLLGWQVRLGPVVGPTPAAHGLGSHTRAVVCSRRRLYHPPGHTHGGNVALIQSDASSPTPSITGRNNKGISISETYLYFLSFSKHWDM